MEDQEDLIELLGETAEEQKEVIDESWETAEDAVVEAEDPQEVGVSMSGSGEEFEASVIRGRDIYLGSNAGCTKCHGTDGRGVAKLSGADAMDLWGKPNPPRNLTLGLWRGGRQPIDLYRRIHEGIAGSSMPGQGATRKFLRRISGIWSTSCGCCRADQNSCRRGMGDHQASYRRRDRPGTKAGSRVPTASKFVIKESVSCQSGVCSF